MNLLLLVSSAKLSARVVVIRISAAWSLGYLHSAITPDYWKISPHKLLYHVQPPMSITIDVFHYFLCFFINLECSLFSFLG